MLPLTPGDAALQQRALFDTTITVYGRGSDGRLSQVLHQDVRAHLAELGVVGAATAPDRMELGAYRELYWDPGVVLPETAQIQDAATETRWNPVVGTFGAFGRGAIVALHCTVSRAKA